jgi:hypothetical protein
MKNTEAVQILDTVSLELADHEARLEKINAGPGQEEELRFSCWRQDKLQKEPLILDEQALVDLLQAAIRTGLLPHSFLGKLREGIEI